METFKIHYKDSQAQILLLRALADLLDNSDGAEFIYLCIGSDRHILDCFGPLIGTMLQARVPGLPVLGTLDQPLHAQNLPKSLHDTQKLHLGKTIVAIDASVGDEKEIGFLQVRPGSLMPGKAYAKNLPAIGHFSITGVVDVRLSRRGARSSNHAGLGMVYNMAQVLTKAIEEWYYSTQRS